MPQSSQSVVGDEKVVSIHYVLTNGAGEVLDRSDDEPLAYLHGADNIIPGLEQALTGKAAGDKLNVTIPPAEAYGERVGPGPQAISRTAFPPEMPLQPGMQFETETEEGESIPIWVTDVDDNVVYVDVDHPLAGETLHFDVTVVEVRDASREEVAHGHPHGPGGHHH